MNQTVIALAAALALAGTLTACGGNDTKPNTSGSGSMGSGSASAGQVSQRSSRPTGKAWDYLDDARYAAGSNGKVYGGDGNAVTRDLTQGARDLMRGTGDAIGDVSRGVGDAVQDIGNGMGDAVNDMGRGMTGKY